MNQRDSKGRFVKANTKEDYVAKKEILYEIAVIERSLKKIKEFLYELQ